MVAKVPPGVTHCALAALLFALLLAACGGTGTKTAASPAKRSSTLLGRGRQLYVADGCEDCHTLNGAAATGPTWKGLFDSRVALSSGASVTANAAYLTQHIVNPYATTVRGYAGAVMAEAIQGDDLASKPGDVRALVALIESLATPAKRADG